MTTQEAWQKQSERMEFYRSNHLDLVIRKNPRSETEKLDEIGISNLPKNKALGYLRLHPEDFIVEEIMLNGQTARINDLKIAAGKDKALGENTLYCRLIKISIPTDVAITRIAQIFKIDENKIGRSGLKDGEAITSQQISLSNLNFPIEKIIKAKIPNVYLSGFYYGKGALNPGDLRGNKFTITVRTEKNIDDKVKINIETMEKFGALNYFQSQRFGSLRRISHKLGKLIMQGNYELAIKYFLLKSGPDDIPLIVQLRKNAEKNYPDWTKIKQTYEELPYTFFNEIRLLNYLIEEPENFIGALIGLENQTQLWAYAYSSWLFNKYLSEYAKNKGCVKEKFPLLTSDDPEDIKIYQQFLEEDQTVDFIKNLWPFKFIQFKKRLVSGRIFAKNFDYKTFDGGVIISFTLPKGAYATTFLTNLFELVQGLPMPDWVKTEKIDPLEIMGQGNLNELKQIFKDCWTSKIDFMV